MKFSLKLIQILSHKMGLKMKHYPWKLERMNKVAYHSEQASIFFDSSAAAQESHKEKRSSDSDDDINSIKDDRIVKKNLLE